MEPADLHLAQVNIAHLIEPMDSERLASFVAALDPVNATADAASGFVWRLKTEEGNATSLKAFEWDLDGSSGVITNMSVWESFEALKDFVYSPKHLEILKKNEIGLIMRLVRQLLCGGFRLDTFRHSKMQSPEFERSGNTDPRLTHLISQRNFHPRIKVQDAVS